MTAYEARIPLFDEVAPLYRFAHPGVEARAPRPRPEAALRRAIEALDPSRTRRLVLPGSDPFAHPALPALVEAAKERGIATSALEGLASAFSGARAAEAEELGVEEAIAWMGGARAKVHAAAARDPGGLEAAMEGLSALARGPIALKVALPLIRWTEADALPLLEWLLSIPGALAAYLPALPEVGAVPPGARALLLSFAEQSEAAAPLFALGRRHGVRCAFYGRRGPSPCASRALDAFGTAHLARLRHLRTRPELAPRPVAACAECSLRESCPGVEEAYLGLFGEAELSPVPLEVSSAWRLKADGEGGARDYKNVSAFDHAVEGKGRSLLRVNGHCQMACAFCFVDRSVPDYPKEALLEQIEGLAERHRDHLVLSGGEPTLHPDLLELIARARELGFREIEIQTNGVRAADPGYAAALREAGLSKATVSLHSMEAEASDAITMMKGAFPKSLEALRQFRALGVEIQIAHVITKANYRALPAFVRAIREALPPREAPFSVCFAIAQGISDLVYTWTIPRFSEAAPYLREALDLCLESGIGFGGLIGQGGTPPCVLGGELRYYEKSFERIYRSKEHQGDFHKPARCAECSFDPYCLGIRREYLRCYGDDEVRPFLAPPEALRGLRAMPPAAPSEPLEGHMPRPTRGGLVALRRKAQ